MKLFQIVLASVAALALVSAPALAEEPLPSLPAAPAQAAPVPAPAQAAPVPAPAQAAPAQAALPPTGHTGHVDDDAFDAEAMKKLTGDQIMEVMRQRAVIAAAPRSEELIAIVVPVSSFLFIFLTVAGGLYFGARKDRERHQTLRAMIERGGSLPPELLVPPVKKHSDLRRGLILVTGGLGLSIFVGATPIDNGAWTVGLIPMLIGIGYLVAWKLMPRESQPIRDEAAIAAEREVNNL